MCGFSGQAGGANHWEAPRTAVPPPTIRAVRSPAGPARRCRTCRATPPAGGIPSWRAAGQRGCDGVCPDHPDRGSPARPAGSHGGSAARTSRSAPGRVRSRDRWRRRVPGWRGSSPRANGIRKDSVRPWPSSWLAGRRRKGRTHRRKRCSASHVSGRLPARLRCRGRRPDEPKNATATIHDAGHDPCSYDAVPEDARTPRNPFPLSGGAGHRHRG